MLIIISPSKNLDFKKPIPLSSHTLPDELRLSTTLIDRLRQLTPEDIGTLFNINPKLAQLNYDRFRDWHLPFTTKNARQAIFAFSGEVYNGLNALTLSKRDLTYAQNHLRILSGLYGALRPLDLIQPYRLEMGIPLDTSNAETLYEFWGDLIRQSIVDAIDHSGKDPVLINLASQEYFKAIQHKKVTARIIDIDFLEMRNGKFKPITVYMKKARGMMTRFAIDNRITNPNDLKTFDTGGYAFAEEISEKNKWVFVR